MFFLRGMAEFFRTHFLHPPRPRVELISLHPLFLSLSPSLPRCFVVAVADDTFFLLSSRLDPESPPSFSLFAHQSLGDIGTPLSITGWGKGTLARLCPSLGLRQEGGGEIARPGLVGGCGGRPTPRKNKTKPQLPRVTYRLSRKQG